MRGTEQAATARLGELFADQVLRWSQRSLVELGAPAGPFVLDVALREQWAEHPEATQAWLQAVDEAAWARGLVRWLRSRLQFLMIEETWVRGLLARALRLAGADPAAALELVRTEIGDVVRGQFGELVEVVCSEYSPELQLRVLGLNLGDVRGPLLDVGCGERRGLTATLAGRGISAQGIDRVHGDDWLQYAYGFEQWGTIVSHHGFSLHFLHHHRRAGPMAMNYARVYMEILRSLQRGGVFAYAPGLPFIEGMLPKNLYRVVQVALPAELEAAAARAGSAALHATQVWLRDG